MTGEIMACAGCTLNRLPDLRSFLVEGEVDYYHGVTKSWRSGGAPQVILTIYHNGKYSESVVLSDILTKPEMHRLMRQKGFRLKDSEGRKAAKDAAETDIREEAAWRAYRLKYFERRRIHAYEFRAHVVAGGVAGRQRLVSIRSDLLEENFDRINHEAYVYVKTGRWPEKKKKVKKKKGTIAQSTGKANNATSGTGKQTSLSYPLKAQHSSESIRKTAKKSSPPPAHVLLQHKVDIEEKIRAIKRKRLLGGNRTNDRMGRRKRRRGKRQVRALGSNRRSHRDAGQDLWDASSIARVLQSAMKKTGKNDPETRNRPRRSN